MRWFIPVCLLWACNDPTPGTIDDMGTMDALTDTAVIDAMILDIAGPDVVVSDGARPDIALDAASPDAMTPDVGYACPPWTPPPGLGGAFDADTSLASAELWFEFRGAREQERMEATLYPERVRQRYRIEQEWLDEGCVSLDQAIDVGRGLFTRTVTYEDGFGSGDRTHVRRFQNDDDPAPDATRCVDCHWKGGLAGAGDRADNAFFFGDGEDRLTHDMRNPPVLWGAGWTQRIGVEMTEALHAQAAAAADEAAATAQTIRIPLSAKGISFGQLSVQPNGEWDTERILGVDPDLVIKPFGWKGTFPTIRAFARVSLKGHLGIEVGPGDGDNDGISHELTEGQLSALVLFLATLETPIIEIPSEADASSPQSAEPEFVDAPEYIVRWLAGVELFESLGCASCHIPFMPIDSPMLAIAGQTIDLREVGASPHPTQGEDGRYLVPVFSDFKRHEMGLYLRGTGTTGGVAEGRYMTRRLWGLARSSPYLHDGSAATFDEAIAMHGGPGSEAAFAVDAWNAMNGEGKSALRMYLYSLRRAPTIRIR